jgi:hypothetical protein
MNISSWTLYHLLCDEQLYVTAITQDYSPILNLRYIVLFPVYYKRRVGHFSATNQELCVTELDNGGNIHMLQLNLTLFSLR